MGYDQPLVTTIRRYDQRACTRRGSQPNERLLGCATAAGAHRMQQGRKRELEAVPAARARELRGELGGCECHVE